YAVAMEALSRELGCILLLKGRLTRVTAPGQPIYAFNAGHSSSATPGSGDVLSGILGAVLAQMHLYAVAMEALSRELGCILLLKGRLTRVTAPGQPI
ncbi:hypothetical protein HT105_24080, partial [Bacteroides fragilis]|nr:hypothetical protein [Bacteroides fragilis]